MIVSSVAPPTNGRDSVRTVTRALAFTPMPSLATPSMVDLPTGGVGAIDHLRIDARLHRVENRFAGAFRGEIDGARMIERERDA